MPYHSLCSVWDSVDMKGIVISIGKMSCISDLGCINQLCQNLVLKENSANMVWKFDSKGRNTGKDYVLHS
jgi:hypothetical protein